MKTRYLLLALSTLLLFLVFRFLLPLVLPFVLAYFFAKTVAPVIHFLTSKLKWRKKVSSIMVVVLVILALGGFITYIVSIAIGQAILLVQKIPVYEQLIEQMEHYICGRCDRMLELASGTSLDFVEAQTQALYTRLGDEILPWLSSMSVRFAGFAVRAGSGLFIFFLSTLLILLDESFPKIHKKIKPFVSKLKYAGFAYIKAQAIIIFLNATILSIGLMIMKNEYALLLGIGIAVFDAFPVVGSGIVLIPWTILKMIGGDFYHAAMLISIFLIASLIREVLEPRLFGKEIGMKPLFVLISVYIGVKLFHVSGIILGPIALAVLKTVNEMIKEKTGERKCSPE